MSAAPKFTPGPWTISRSRSGYPYQICALKQDDSAPGRVGTRITRWGAISLPSSAEGEANASLIAAAPELYEALRAVIAEADEGRIVSASGDYIESRGPHHVMQDARAALAKATGETP